MARFFIDRPIFAWVIAIIIMLAGALAIETLPVSQYPQIAPPQIAINAIYPGASAQTVEDTVTQVIEQKMNGIDNLLYMSSSSDSAGAVAITLTFAAGTDPNIAQVQVQNKLQLAMPLLPQIVQRQGVQVVKSTRNFLMIVGLVSEDGSLNRFDLSDYVVSNVQDIISRVAGVGEVQIFGSQYAMRIWLDPRQAERVPPDPGRRGRRAPGPERAGLGRPVRRHARRRRGSSSTRRSPRSPCSRRPEQFDAIVLRTDADGSTVRLRDVARSEIGTENYDMLVALQGQAGRRAGDPAGGRGQRPGDGRRGQGQDGGAVAASSRPGMKVIYPFDTTPFVRVSIEEVVKTLVEAIVLVFLVMFLFLQNFRATLIPTIAVPVVLLGTFGVLSASGFSINTLTMFAHGAGDRPAGRRRHRRRRERRADHDRGGAVAAGGDRKSMGQITGALWGIALVLSAVFVPMAFFGGSTGVIYRQFSITIVSAMMLSVLVAMILTPALCATLLKPVEKGHRRGEIGWFGWFFRWFNRGFDRGSATLPVGRAADSLDGRGALHARLRGDRRGHGRALPADADRLPPRRGPGLHHLPGPAAGRRDAGADPEGHRAARAALSWRTSRPGRRRRC